MSVPSIFSQLYEQADAFSNIVNNYPYGNPIRDSEEERITSLCLDLFELILMKGSEVNVAHIDMGDIHLLSQSSNSSHQLLASILTEDLQHPSYRNISDWYLFGWHDVSLGGTSPMTMVYTNPNILYELEERNIDIRGFCGNRLFRDIVPLFQRGDQFKDFMYEYKESFPLPTPLREYIHLSMQIDHYVLHPVPIAITSKYEVLKDSYGNPIYVNGIPLMHIPLRVEEESDYKIIPNKDVTGNLPLVLSESGLPGARYVLGMEWDPYTFRIPPYISGIPLEERILPGTNIRYPFITIYDLLEPRIIQVPKGIDSRRFITCCIGDSNYLLPIRTMYFEYFTPEDLMNSLFIETGVPNGSVRVRLSVPVRGGVIEFQRLYHDEDIVKLNINIAITPFYQMKGEVYHLLCSNTKNTGLHIGYSNSTDIDTSVSHTTRYQDDECEVGGYTIHNSWDYLTVCSYPSDNDAVVGIVIPIFKWNHAANDNCVFCVDIGDSYTSIMHKSFHGHAPQTLCIDESAAGILCPEDESFKSQIKRFFLGAFDTTRAYSPLKNLITGTYDAMHNPQNGKFMENYNIALDYNSFQRIEGECTVRPSLHKLNRPLDIEYLRAYFEGLLFFMRQEAMLRYNNPTFDLRVAVPSYLNVAERAIVEHLWEDVRHGSGTDDGKETAFVSNSAALSLFTHFSIALPHDFVNINIDSMHTNISYCDNEGRVRTLCVDMGIGDLFQNTMRLYGNDDYFVNRVTHQYLFANGVYSPDEQKVIDSRIQYDQWSLFDVFENESGFAEKSLITHCDQLGACAMEIETVYLIGLFYYLGRYLGEMNIRLPHAVVFSGLGAKYLTHYLRYDRSVEHLFDSVMRLVLGDDYESRNTRVLFYENPTQAISKGLMIDGMEVDEVHDYFYGLDDNVNEPVTFREVIDGYVRDDIHSTFRHFIDVLNSNELTTVLFRELNVSLGIVMNNKGALEHMAMDSVNMCLNENLEFKDPEYRCNSALFFWSLKHSLYEWLKNNC